MARRRDDRSLLPVVDRLVDQRSIVAWETVQRLREEHPGASTDELADLLIRRCVKEMALGGAVTGGAAASPVAGVAVAAASAGADATYSVGRLSEMIMGLGLLYGHEAATPEERRGWIIAVLGISEGAAVGLTGLAARLGSRGGARLLSRLPDAASAGATAGRGTKALARMKTTKGPWGLAALVPYGIGASVGAAGNAVLAQSVGTAAKQFFAADAAGLGATTSGDAAFHGPHAGEHLHDDVLVDDDVIDGEVVDEVILDEVVDGDPGPRRAGA
ncbi:MAG: hypothetical protein ACOYOP_15570 [Microthrixaceae bacterium]